MMKQTTESLRHGETPLKRRAAAAGVAGRPSQTERERRECLTSRSAFVFPVRSDPLPASRAAVRRYGMLALKNSVSRCPCGENLQ